MRYRVLFVSGLWLAACGSDSSSSPPNATGDDGGGGQDAGTLPAQDGAPPASDAGTSDAPVASDAPHDAPPPCTRTPGDPNAARKIVVSHPFGVNAGDKATAFEVVDLAADGTMTRPAKPVTFDMGTALDSPIVFTPDGAVGLVAQDDGSVGSFRLDAAGKPTVVHAAYKAGFYASAVVMDPSGEKAWVLDSDTAANGGGVYEVTIGCDGTLTSQGLAIAIAPAHAMAIFPGDPKKAVVASSGDLHVVDLVTKKSVVSGKPFGDDNALPSSVAVAPDGKYALVADDYVQGGNRMAWAALGATIGTGATLATPYPAAVEISPFGNAAIVLNDDSTDQIHVMSYDPSNAAAPFAITGELAYKFGKPQIPVTVMTILRGNLKGRAFIGENVAVRELTFGANGTVTDTQKLDIPGDNTSIVGVVGVQP